MVARRFTRQLTIRTLTPVKILAFMIFVWGFKIVNWFLSLEVFWKDKPTFLSFILQLILLLIFPCKTVLKIFVHELNLHKVDMCFLIWLYLCSTYVLFFFSFLALLLVCSIIYSVQHIYFFSIQLFHQPLLSQYFFFCWRSQTLLVTISFKIFCFQGVRIKREY